VFFVVDLETLLCTGHWTCNKYGSGICCIWIREL